MTNEADIQKAIDDLDSQEAPNYSAIARKFNIDRKTLQRRHQGMSRSIQQAHSESLQLLTDGQEEVLIRHINNLSDRGLPSTPQFLRNLVFEIVKKQPGKNWVVLRHQLEGTEGGWPHSPEKALTPRSGKSLVRITPQRAEGGSITQRTDHGSLDSLDHGEPASDPP